MEKFLIRNHSWFIRRIEDSQNCYNLMNIENGDVFEINETTKFVFDLCDGTNTQSTIIEKTLQKKDLSIDENEVATAEDINNLLHFLLSENICNFCDSIISLS
jgi:hypothetical protein